MKIKITDELAVGYADGDCLLINSEGDVAAVSGNTEFNDLGIEIPVGEYLVVKVLPPTCKLKEQLGCTLEIVGCQWHHSKTEVQEYILGNMPTSLVTTP